MALLTLPEAKLQLNIDSADTDHDVEIQSFIDAASVVVENHTGEKVDAEEFVEVHGGSQRRQLAVSWTPVTAVESVASVDGDRTWDVADIHINGSAGVLTVKNGSPFCGDVIVTYTAGYTVAPANYNLAGRIIVQHLWQTQRGATGMRSGGPLADSFQNTMGGGRGYLLPNAAVEALGETGPSFA